MKQSVILFMVGFLCLQTALGQGLFMSRDIQQAYKNGTRAMDGTPGKNYWQNHGRYAIDITALPPNRTITGKETIVYSNESPDTLNFLNIKLFLNIHKPGAPRNSPASPDYLSTGVKIDQFKVNGTARSFPSNNYVFTNAGVRLPTPLLPHDSVQLYFEWHYDISLESGREGMIDSTTYFLAYFYPRVAVYDDYNGWDRMPFMDSHEFYSDFNDYEVSITVPGNYIVWGTGTLQQPETVLQPEILKRFNESLQSDQVINVVTKKDLEEKRVTTRNARNTWKFVAVNIPDMAFGVSDHFVWDATSTVVDKATGRRAGAQAAFNDTAADYHHVAGYAAHALSWLSQNWPGVPYPYEKTTVFQGYAGMEYPMMANDETYADTVFSRFVAEHEIAHTYMPFYMGINETRYGFMDEGWATTFEYLIGTDDLGKAKAGEFFKQFRVSGWTQSTESDLQVPIITPGDAMTGYGFGTNEYGKAAIGYLAAKDLLGDEMFRKCLHAYMTRWHGKHPIPWDFFNTFNDVSGRNLNWFWNNRFFSTAYNDYALSEIRKTVNGYLVGIKNIGGFFSPLDMVIHYTDSTKETKHLTPGIWEKNGVKVSVPVITKKKIASVQLDGGIWMDADEHNNTLTADKKGS